MRVLSAQLDVLCTALQLIEVEAGPSLDARGYLSTVADEEEEGGGGAASVAAYAGGGASTVRGGMH